MKNKYSNDQRIALVHDESLQSDLCNDTISFKQFSNETCTNNIKEFLINRCSRIFDRSNRSKFRNSKEIGTNMDAHRVVTYNDCFTILSKTYEFIEIIDFDEFIFPRNLDNLKDFFSKNSSYSCDSKSQDLICQVDPFTYKSNRPEAINNNYIYEYINSLIKSNQRDRDMTKLSSIQFQNAATMTQDAEKQLVNSLESVVQQIESNKSLLFPIKILANKNHIFLMEKNDVDYVKYLLDSYKNFISCAYTQYMNKIKIIDKNLIRAFYYLTSYYERPKKSVYHCRNARSMGIHTIRESRKDTWDFSPFGLSGHFTPHYRGEIYKVAQNFTSTIRDLNIDFEYMFFILKNYADFCIKTKVGFSIIVYLK